MAASTPIQNSLLIRAEAMGEEVSTGIVPTISQCTHCEDKLALLQVMRNNLIAEKPGKSSSRSMMAA